MEKIIHLKIRSREGIILETDASYIDVPMINCRYGFLYNHAPLMGALAAGKVRYDVDGEQKFIEINDGIVRTENNIVDILTY